MTEKMMTFSKETFSDNLQDAQKPSQKAKFKRYANGITIEFNNSNSCSILNTHSAPTLNFVF